MRATMRGLADAIADPTAAAGVAVELINGNGNPNFLSPEGEVFRWETDAALVTATTPEGSHPGVPDPEGLAAEIAAYDAVGVYGTRRHHLRSTTGSTTNSSPGSTTPTARHLAGRLNTPHRPHVAPRSGRGDLAGVFDVLLELLDQRVDAVELPLRTEKPDEPDPGRLTVEVTFEVDQVRFEQRTVGVLVEGRTATEVDRTRMAATRQAVRRHRRTHRRQESSTRLDTSTLAVGNPRRRPR